MFAPAGWVRTVVLHGRRSPIRDTDRLSRWAHRHATRAARRPSSAHVAAVVHDSPARADAPDATAWLPVPEPDALPEVEELLNAAPDGEAIALREVPVAQPSPARAEPHDETSWLPLPEIEDLPPIGELLEPTAAGDPLEARLLPVVARPSPARAEPHDETAWLPLPEIADLPDITEIVEADQASAPAATAPGRRTRRLVGGASPRRALGIALVVASIAFGVWAVPKVFNNRDHVSLQVDGRLISAQSGQDNVGAFLREQKIRLGPADRVDPKPATALSDGMTVRVLRAFPVTVELDGTSRVVYTAASVPRDLVNSLNVPGLVIRTAPKQLQAGSVLQLRTRRQGTLAVDGQIVPYNLPVLTVQELLDNYKVVLGPQDRTSPGLTAVLAPANAIVGVIRVAQDVQSVDVNYQLPDSAPQPDPNLNVGETRDQAAVTGVMRITYQIVRNNGAEVSRTAVSQVPIVPAQPHIPYYGTRTDPRWEEIARCETGKHWSMQSPQFSGGLAFYNGTWNMFGGQQFAPNAGLASREQQIIVAERIRARYGFGAWGCGKELGYG